MANNGDAESLKRTVLGTARDWVLILGACGGCFIVNALQIVSREWLGAEMSPTVDLLVVVLDLSAVATIVSTTLLRIRKQWTAP